MSEQQTEKRIPFYAKCVECKHIWIAAYTPMNLTVMAKLIKQLHCPMCGADAAKITPAKQCNGVLQEPQT